MMGIDQKGFENTDVWNKWRTADPHSLQPDPHDGAGRSHKVQVSLPLWAAAGMRDPPPPPNATTRVQEGLRAHHEASFAERRCKDTDGLRLCGPRDSTQTWDNQPWLHPTAHWAPVTKGRPTGQGSMAARPQWLPGPRGGIGLQCADSPESVPALASSQRQEQRTPAFHPQASQGSGKTD